MKIRTDDPRLTAPQCTSLAPVETVHENPWFTVCNRGGYYTVEHNQPQVAVLPVLENRAIIMVRVKRPVIADITLELPAGGMEGNEQPAQAAARELAEETGIEINNIARFKRLSPFAIIPRAPLLPHLFQIHITHQEYERRRKCDDEIESVECLEFNEIVTKIVENEIYMALPVAILSRFLFENYRSVL